jgi:hypothetical protein
MPDTRSRTLAVLFALSPTLTAPLDAQAERHTLQGTDVAVYNLAGVIRVEPAGAAGAAAVVEITRGGRHAERLRVVTGELRGVQTLRVIYPADEIAYGEGHSSAELRVREDGTFGDNGDAWRDGRRVRITSRGGGLDAHADLRVGVPKGQRIAVYLGVGRVFVTNVDGHLRVDVASADVTVATTRGPLTIDTGSGNVTATDAEGDLSIDTGSGNVTVTRMRGPGLRIDTGSGNATAVQVEADVLEIDTGSGDVDATGVRAQTIHLDTGSGNVELAVLADADRIDIDTGSGNVTLVVPESFGAEVEVETGSGDIDLGFPVQARRLERDHFVGTIGDGRGSVTIGTGSGGVRLLKS